MHRSKIIFFFYILIILARLAILILSFYLSSKIGRSLGGDVCLQILNQTFINIYCIHTWVTHKMSTLQSYFSWKDELSDWSRTWFFLINCRLILQFQSQFLIFALICSLRCINFDFFFIRFTPMNRLWRFFNLIFSLWMFSPVWWALVHG